MFRRFIGALASVVLVVSCSAPASTPLAPLPALPTITGLVVSTDRLHVPFPLGTVTLSLRASTSEGRSALGLSARVTTTIDGAVATNDIPFASDGTASQVFTFSKPGSIAVSAGSFAQTLSITQDAPPAPPVPPSTCNPCAPAPTPAIPALSITASSSNYLPRVNETFTLSATASSADGVTPSVQIEWDLDANGSIDFISPPGANAAISFSFLTVGPKMIVVRTQDSRGRTADTTIRLQVQP